MTDGTSNMRIVGFSPDQQKKLASFLELKQPTHLINCEVKPSRQGDKLEIMLKKFTEIAKSPKKIEVPDQLLEPDTPTLFLLQ